MVRKQKIMIPRLRTILDKCANKKFRNGYITYLKSLDYDEFEKTVVTEQYRLAQIIHGMGKDYNLDLSDLSNLFSFSMTFDLIISPPWLHIYYSLVGS